MLQAIRRFVPGIVRASLLTAAIASVACQPLFGIERRDEDPVLEGCTLPAVTPTQAMLRVGTFVPSDAKVDVCVRESGREYDRPLLRGGGKSCEPGLVYPQLTALFGVSGSSVDVKIIPAGQTCKAKALSELTNIKVKPKEETTVLRIGPANREELRAYPAGALRGGERLKLRVIHAVANSVPHDFGLTDVAVLPAQLTTTLFDDPLAFGEGTNAATKTRVGPVDAFGYIETPGTSINLGAAPTGTKKAVLTTLLDGGAGPRSVFTIGDPTLPFFPVRALQCGDRDMKNNLTVCTPSKLGTLSVDAFNATLFGHSADFEKPRRDAVPGAIAARNSDLMCLVEVSRKTDRDTVIAEAKKSNAYPYSVTAETDLDTPRPPDKNGNVPAAPAYPSCGGSNDPAKVEAAINCLQTKCSDTGTPEGRLKGGTACISERCAAEFIPLLAADHDHRRCLDCLVVTADSDETHAATRAYCTIDNRDYYSFRGETPSLILSKYPIVKTETFVLPSTIYRRVVHYAKVEIEPMKFIDYYCAQLIGSYGSSLPYYGAYADENGPDPWEEEELLQVERVAEFVKKTSGENVAIVSGDWSASKSYFDGATELVTSKNPKVVEALEKHFVLAVPRDHVPHCTECPTAENPYNGDSKKHWQLKTYVYRMESSVATSAGNFFTERVVPLPDGTLGPLSDRFGFNVNILRP